MNEQTHKQQSRVQKRNAMREDAFLLDLAFGGSLYDEARKDIFALARTSQQERL